MAKAKAKKRERLTAADKAKIKAHAAAKDKGKANYAKADKLLVELLGVLEVGREYPLGDGRVFVIEDQFDDTTTPNPKIWKPSGTSRYQAVITHTD